MSVDPDIDTSLDPKAGSASATPATTPTPTTSATPPDPEPVAEEEFYPPDHHMHSSNAHTGGQTELELTPPPDDTERKSP